MNPSQTVAAYRAALREEGGTLTLRRSLPGGGTTDVVVKARVTGYAPSDLVGAVQQGDRLAIVLAEDVAASGFPLPFLPKQDRAIWAGKTLVIASVDEATRRVGDTLVAYEMRLTGA